jgi:Rps23 Pro-64 3,4-dihydroxylase Tpa1-like proline 4-hydroxylase
MTSSTKSTPVKENPVSSPVKGQEAPLKKARISAPESAVEQVFAPGLLDPVNAETLAEAYKTSSPYLHTCISAFVEPKLLSAVRTEIEKSLVFTEKETDIYKVLQTGDLANIDGLPEDERQCLTNLHRLRNAMYSQTFRDFVSKVTGCGPLSGSKQDMSINSYCQGSHLLNHDDVIGTRRVSYILYLPDPQEWDPKYGGSLELYPCVSKGTPDVVPTKTIPVKWNQFVMFTVQPGYSFHSVQEVVAPHDRLSISGWFHLPQKGEPGYDVDKQDEAAALASLAQLEDDTRDASFPFGEIKDTKSTTDELSKDDISSLSKFINADYLKESNLEQINERFGTDSSIQLVNFLTKEYADSLLLPLLQEADERDGLADGKSTMTHGTGVFPGWKVQGSPVKQRFMVLSNDVQANEPKEATKLRELQNFFRTRAFHKWIYQVSGLVCTHERGRVRRFRPGLDYTLGTSSNVASVLDFTLSITPPNPCWEEGERGGYECYIASDEQNDDPAIYRSASDDTDTLLATQPGWNVLTIVLRDQGVMRFVKYVSALASGSRWDVSCEFLLDMEEEEDDDDDEAGGQEDE